MSVALTLHVLEVFFAVTDLTYIVQMIDLIGWKGHRCRLLSLTDAISHLSCGHRPSVGWTNWETSDVCRSVCLYGDGAEAGYRSDTETGTTVAQRGTFKPGTDASRQPKRSLRNRTEQDLKPCIITGVGVSLTICSFTGLTILFNVCILLNGWICLHGVYKPALGI